MVSSSDQALLSSTRGLALPIFRFNQVSFAPVVKKQRTRTIAARHDLWPSIDI
jgi:hypothetical protein